VKVVSRIQTENWCRRNRHAYL